MKVSSQTYLSASVMLAARGAAGAGSKFFYDDQALWPSVPATPEGSNACDGSRQSPINLDTQDYTCAAKAEAYSFYTGDCTLGDYTFTINDHGLKASVETATCDKPKMIIPGTGKVYEVLQFHIHTGCENTFNNTGCDANLHMVHIAKTDVALPAATASADLPDLAVFDLMMHGVDEHHDSVNSLIDSWSAVSCTNQNCVTVSDDLKSQKFSPYNLIPMDTAVYNFQGSLTTPPCWEVVNWNVSEKPVKMSFTQMLAIVNLIEHYSGYRGKDNTCVADETVASVAGLTSRETQPINGRQITKNCEQIQISDKLPSEAEEQSVVKTATSSGYFVSGFKAASIMGVAVAAFAVM